VRAAAGETRENGAGVSLEDEMLKLASIQGDYQTATAVYGRGLGMIRTALGRRG
jgi:flagellar basal-body rod protein FlgB